MFLAPVLLIGSMQLPEAPRPNHGSTKPTGICVRWESDPEHVADAIVVASSGDPVLDGKLRENTKTMPMRRPRTNNYKGQWIGIIVSTSPDLPKIVPPNCAHLGRSEPKK